MSAVTPVSRRLLDWFHIYLRWYVPRHLHGVRVANLPRFDRAPSPVPTIVVLNHPGWWDPLVSMLLARRAFGDGVESYAPMDAAALKQYGFFRKLGLFPVDLDASGGGETFIKDARAILSRPGTVLWITPQGRFRDARERPLRFRGGLGALLHRLPAARVLPLAIEYTYFDERLPEALLNCGEPLDVRDGTERSAAEWTQACEDCLESTMDQLAALATTRDGTAFEELLRGRAGAGAAYDSVRRARAVMGGEEFVPEHGTIRPRRKAR